MKSSMTQSDTQWYAPMDRGMLAKIPPRYSGQVVAIKNQIINI